MDQLKWFNRDRGPKHSIAAGFSTVLPMFVPALTPREPVVHDSAMQRMNNGVRQGLNVISPITGAIPVAGSPLKASIDALLVLLNALNTRGENRKNVAYLIRRLYWLEAAILAVPPATPSAQYQRDELARKLDAVSGRLKGMRVKSIFGSADIKQAILDCIREIDDQIQHYMVLAQMRIEYILQESATQLPRSVKEEMVSVKDATGREFRLLVDQCRSHKQFMGVLLCYFGDTNRDKVLRDFIARGAYDLYTEAATGTAELHRWSGVEAGTKIIMSAVFEQEVDKVEYMCPRPQCKAWNKFEEAKDGWIECVGCPGRFQITNTERRTDKRSSNFGQITPSPPVTLRDGGYHLDLIQIFHLRQQVQDLWDEDDMRWSEDDMIFEWDSDDDREPTAEEIERMRAYVAKFSLPTGNRFGNLEEDPALPSNSPLDSETSMITEVSVEDSDGLDAGDP